MFTFSETCESKRQKCSVPPSSPPSFPPQTQVYNLQPPKASSSLIIISTISLPFYFFKKNIFIPSISNQKAFVSSSSSSSPAMLMLVNCSNCHTPLQLPPGGATSIRCVLCKAITLVADLLSVPSSSASSSHYQQPPSPYNHAPLGLPPHSHCHKRAVICGVSYKNTGYELKGCINDVNCMKFLLINRFKFPESSIVTLTGNHFFSFEITNS